MGRLPQERLSRRRREQIMLSGRCHSLYIAVNNACWGGNTITCCYLLLCFIDTPTSLL